MARHQDPLRDSDGERCRTCVVAGRKGWGLALIVVIVVMILIEEEMNDCDRVTNPP